MAIAYQFPSKLSVFLRRLDILYRVEKETLLGEIIRSASVSVIENVSYDNWNEGMTGHGAIFHVDETTLEKIPSFDFQDTICNRLRDDLNKASTSILNERVDWVSIDLYDPNEPADAKLIRLGGTAVMNPDNLSIWKSGNIRLFVSHRDAYKLQVAELAEALEEYGISSFVAHANIEPMEEWQEVIRQALQTMEIMLLFITDDFFESVWTNQEIGVALDRGIPIISLKLQATEPKGFVARTQALPGNLEDVSKSTVGVYRVLAEKLGQEERLRKALVEAFITSPDYVAAKPRFERLMKLQTLTENDVQKIISGFSQNSNLRGAYYLVNEARRLLNYLENRTGKSYAIVGNAIVEQKPPPDELDPNIPF